ncbi:hypothetical protein [Glaciimonas immobilis]|uniref:Uncharacterized protein n=1 Tax=Glaciimonas immobilis TaxID=728004 RepID=A0A840S1E4_9BURK|nr:hypothetical protein [Glaciimonas immobilis]KAF3996675.1 hypothetical protein HAV38_18795 [Glaciimonas immobilis]MBB5202521.1 hypothetical protein [Glaciimonas immobilis]
MRNQITVFNQNSLLIETALMKAVFKIKSDAVGAVGAVMPSAIPPQQRLRQEF